MTGHSGDSFSVNDPGYSTGSYPSSGVVRAGIFTKSRSEEGNEEFNSEFDEFPMEIDEFDYEEESVFL